MSMVCTSAILPMESALWVPKQLSARKLSEKGKKLGNIEELMIDMRTQHVAYALMTFGGFLGMGERLFAVPFRAFHNDGIKGHLFLDVDEDSINNAPYIEKDCWPDMADKNWIREIHAFYGVEPYQVGM